MPEELRHFGVRVEDTLLYVDTKTVDVLTKESPRVLAGGSVDVDSGESPFGLACLLE